jgi:hypothetical protein
MSLPLVNLGSEYGRWMYQMWQLSWVGHGVEPRSLLTPEYATCKLSYSPPEGEGVTTTTDSVLPLEIYGTVKPPQWIAAKRLPILVTVTLKSELTSRAFHRIYWHAHSDAKFKIFFYFVFYFPFTPDMNAISLPSSSLVLSRLQFLVFFVVWAKLLFRQHAVSKIIIQ